MSTPDALPIPSRGLKNIMNKLKGLIFAGFVTWGLNGSPMAAQVPLPPLITSCNIIDGQLNLNAHQAFPAIPGLHEGLEAVYDLRIHGQEPIHGVVGLAYEQRPGLDKYNARVGAPIGAYSAQVTFGHEETGFKETVQCLAPGTERTFLSALGR